MKYILGSSVESIVENYLELNISSEDIAFIPNLKTIYALEVTYQYAPLDTTSSNLVLMRDHEISESLKWVSLGDLLDIENTVAYGIEWKDDQKDPHCTRIGNLELHKTLPIQNGIKGCIARKDKVLYYLDKDNWNFKENPPTYQITTDGTDYIVIQGLSNDITGLWIRIKDGLDTYICQVEVCEVLSNSVRVDFSNTNWVNDCVPPGISEDLDNAEPGEFNYTYNLELGNAKLDGTDGCVRVHTPEFWIKSWQENGINKVMISPSYIDSTWTHQPSLLIDAFRSTVRLSGTPRNNGWVDNNIPVGGAVSISSFDPVYSGGDNLTTQLDVNENLIRQNILYPGNICKPRTNMTRTEMRTAAQKSGSNIISYTLYKNIFCWLYFIEYANFNPRETFNPELTLQGYKQGGLDKGLQSEYFGEITKQELVNYNNLNPVCIVGYGNDIGNNTNIKKAKLTLMSSSGYNTHTRTLHKWRGFENIFGDTWTMLDGNVVLKFGNTVKIYITDDVNDFTDEVGSKRLLKSETYSGYTVHVTEYSLGNSAEIMYQSGWAEGASSAPSNPEEARNTHKACTYGNGGPRADGYYPLFANGAVNYLAHNMSDIFCTYQLRDSCHSLIGFRTVNEFNGMIYE